MVEIREYIEESGNSPIAEWFNSLEAMTAARVDRRIRRMEQGNFANSRTVGKGVRELKIDFGPGWRVYYGRDGDKVVVLLGGGSKRGQSRDIRKAQDCWSDYKARKKAMNS